MNREEQVKAIAYEVNKCGLIALPDDNQGFFVAVASNIATATYSGRKNKYSVVRFRAHMILAAAYAQQAVCIRIDDILAERIRQNKIWGVDFDRKNTANDWHAYVGHYISKAMQPGENYEENMMKAACICQGAVLMCDLFGGPAPRHYDDLPGAGGHCEHCGREEGANHVCPNVTVVNNVMLDKPKEEI